jgi:hypothetical protein
VPLSETNLGLRNYAKESKITLSIKITILNLILLYFTSIQTLIPRISNLFVESHHKISEMCPLTLRFPQPPSLALADPSVRTE